MTPISETQVIEQKLKELKALVEQREQLQAKIAKTESAIKAFIELLEDELDQQIYAMKLTIASKPMGLTDSIKVILVANKKLTPGDVRDKLTQQGFPLSGYANPLAVIYTTLNRLFDQKLVTKHEDGTYEWVSIPEDKRVSVRLADMAGIPRSTATQRVMRGLRAGRDKKD